MTATDERETINHLPAELHAARSVPGRVAVDLEVLIQLVADSAVLKEAIGAGLIDDETAARLQLAEQSEGEHDHLHTHATRYDEDGAPLGTYVHAHPHEMREHLHEEAEDTRALIETEVRDEIASLRRCGVDVQATDDEVRAEVDYRLDQAADRKLGR